MKARPRLVGLTHHLRAENLQVTDLLLGMVAKASRQDEAFLIDLASLQEKHLEAAKQLLGPGTELNKFAARLLEDISNLKAMLQAISIGIHSAFSQLLSVGTHNIS